MKSFYLDVDYREVKLCEYFLENNVDIQKKNLLIGDIHVTFGDSVLYVIERKTVSDLCASIIDNRFREQKERLCKSILPEKTIYIIENYQEIYSRQNRLPKETLLSAILNLSIKHNFHVFYTNDYVGTAELVRFILEKSKSESFKDSCFQPIVKKSDHADKNALAFQLTTIQGVSFKIAMKIQEEYGDMKKFIEEFDVVKIADIKVSEKKRLGKALAIKIQSALGLS